MPLEKDEQEETTPVAPEVDSDGSDKDMVAFLKESKSGGEAKKPQPEDPEAPPIVDGKLRVNLLGSSM